MITIKARNIVIITIIIAIAHIYNAYAAPVLRQGNKGDDVTHLQEILQDLGYLQTKPDGIFGKDTSRAVMSFQADHGLTADGVCGTKTQQALDNAAASINVASRSRIIGQSSAARPDEQIDSYTVAAGDSLWSIGRQYGLTSQQLADYNGLEPTAILAIGCVLKLPEGASRGGKSPDNRALIELLSWEQANTTIPRGRSFIITDVRTGRSFEAMRRGGTWHADSEPLTAGDTAVFSSIIGGNWSWERRSVVITLGSRKLAASINCMPHGSDHISGNNFNGMFCVHFLGSRIHGSGLVDPDHQAMILAAAEYKGGIPAIGKIASANP